ncbi:MAG: hypothetical protein ACTSYX_05620 [Candidatus Thorarchaeota archaeon]
MGEDLGNWTLQELFFSLTYDLDVALAGRTVTAIEVLMMDNSTSLNSIGLWVDDLFATNGVDVAQDDQLWTVLRASDSSYYDYLALDQSYTDTVGVGMHRLESDSGVMVYAHGPTGTVRMINGLFSTGPRLNLSLAGNQTAMGSAYIGPMIGVSGGEGALRGQVVDGSVPLDIVEEGELQYLADTEFGAANLTVTYLFDNGTASGHTVTVSGLSGHSTDGSVVYLNVTEALLGRRLVTLDVYTLFLGLGITEGKLPVLYTFTTGPGIQRVYEVSPVSLTPLLSHTGHSTIHSPFAQSSESGYGIDTEGYVTAWIVSPHDVMDSALYIHDASVTGRLTRKIMTPSYNTTVKYYQYLDFWTDTDPDLPGGVPGNNSSPPTQAYDYSSGWSTTIEMIDDSQVTDRALSIRVERVHQVQWNWKYDNDTHMWIPDQTNPVKFTADFYRFEVRKYEWLPEGGLHPVIIGSLSVDSSTVHDQWVEWTIDLWAQKIYLYPVSASGTPLANLQMISMSEDHQLDYLTDLAIVEDMVGCSGNVSWYLDDLRVLAHNGTQSIIREAFSRGDLSALTAESCWTLSTDAHQFELSTSKNIGLSRSVLHIDPMVLADYSSTDAQLEFLDGWSSVTRYNKTAYGDFLSGHDELMNSWIRGKWYQHYFSVLEVPTHGYYSLVISALPYRSLDAVKLWIDGHEVMFTASGDEVSVSVYLGTGLHSLHLRLYSDGGPRVNAFRLRVVGASGASGWRAYVPHHGRYVAVYYDQKHYTRLQEGGSPSYYVDSQAMHDKADVLLVSDAIGGLKVVLDAHDLLDYMMRDINTMGSDEDGLPVSPLYETAGSVIFTSDAIPDTIYQGEYSGSIIERYLEGNGEVSLDGNLPFYMTTHSDGSASIWPRGAESILDMDVDEAWYHADNAEITYGVQDIPYDGLFTDTPLDPELWATEYTYEFPITQREHDPAETLQRITLGTGGINVEYFDILGNWQVIFSNKDDSAYKTLFAPGRTKIKVRITPSQDNLVRPCLGPLHIDGKYVWNSTNTIAAIDGDSATSLGTFQASPLDVQLQSGVPIDIEFDLSRVDIFYDAIVQTMTFNLILYKIDCGTPSASPFVIESVSVEKEFSVRTHRGIADDFAMLLPSPQTGTLADMHLREVVLPRYGSLYTSMRPLIHALGQGTSPIMTATAKILAPGDTTQSTLTLASQQDTLDLALKSMDSGCTLSELDFKDASGAVSSVAYHLGFEASSSDYSGIVATRFYWNVKQGGTNESLWSMPTKTEIIHQYWMPDLTVVLRRTPLGTVTTPTGHMIVGDLTDYTPLWSLDTQYLRDHGRRYIEYGTWSHQVPPRYANPITFQADRWGGGVVTFGVSPMISQEHAWRNISLSEAYMDLIARANHINLWGHSVLGQLVSNVRLNYSVEDRLELWNQEGWFDEAMGSLSRGIDPEHTPARLGNGLLDQFVDSMAPDFDGADWYPQGAYTTTSTATMPISNAAFLANETLHVHPSVLETSDWDEDSPDHPLRSIPLLGALASAGSIVRHQVIRGESVPLYLDWPEQLPAGVTTVYLTVQLEVAGATYWINRTVDRSSTVFEFDLRDLAGHCSADLFGDNGVVERSGVPLWVSDNRSLMTVPVLRVWAYRKDPQTIQDLPEQIRNLVYADLFYLKMAYDEGFIDTYMERVRVQEEEAARMKKGMLVLGVLMMAAGYFDPPLLFWGADMISQSLTDKSLLDHLAQGAMHGANAWYGTPVFNENYIGNFSVWHATADRGLDLVYQLVLSEAISFGISRGASRIGWGVTSNEEALVATAMRTGGGGLGGWLKRVVTSVGGDRFMWWKRVVASVGARYGSHFGWLKRAVSSVGKTYWALGFQVLTSLAFEGMARVDPNKRTPGGSDTFMALMTASMLVRIVLETTGRHGGPAASQTSRIRWSRTLLSVTGMVLSAAQMALLLQVAAINSTSDGGSNGRTVSSSGGVP